MLLAKLCIRETAMVMHGRKLRRGERVKRKREEKSHAERDVAPGLRSTHHWAPSEWSIRTHRRSALEAPKHDSAAWCYLCSGARLPASERARGGKESRSGWPFGRRRRQQIIFIFRHTPSLLNWAQLLLAAPQNSFFTRAFVSFFGFICLEVRCVSRLNCMWSAQVKVSAHHI